MSNLATSIRDVSESDEVTLKRAVDTQLKLAKFAEKLAPEKFAYLDQRRSETLDGEELIRIIQDTFRLTQLNKE